MLGAERIQLPFGEQALRLELPHNLLVLPARLERDPRRLDVSAERLGRSRRKRDFNPG